MKPYSALLFNLILYNEEEIFFKVKDSLLRSHSNLYFESQTLPSWTKSTPVSTIEKSNFAKVISFEQKINRDELPIRNKNSLAIRSKYLKLDPGLNIFTGYITKHNVILASDEDDYYRLYLYEDTFAEVIYKYEKQKLLSLESTPPFFRTKECIYFFTNLRDAFESYSS